MTIGPRLTTYQVMFEDGSMRVIVDATLVINGSSFARFYDVDNRLIVAYPSQGLAEIVERREP